MTRKDYELIAKVLKTQLELSRDSYNEEDGVFATLNIIYDLAEELAKENSRFDKERFFIACGVYDVCDKCPRSARLFTSKTRACSEQHAPEWVQRARQISEERAEEIANR